MYTNQFHFARPAFCGWVALAACVALIAAPLAGAQEPAASGYAAPAPSTAELDNLVGPIALYPDDLVALVLPASTNPLQIVQADRFLDKRKKDPKLPIDNAWDDSVKSLVNYPDVVKKMSLDLDWTSDLGEAVVADQGAVLDAVQVFRRKAQTAGNLKTDTKQTVVVETEVIKIVPADPQVIYVPQYNPTTVVAYSSVPVYGYYPAPYPSYYYPYPPGAALATGLIFGAAIGAAWNGNHYGTNWGGGNNNITINRGDRTINTGNINTGNLNRARAQSTQATAWRSDKRPGQVRSGSTRPATTSARFNNARPGDAAGGARAATQRSGGMQDRATRTGASSRDALGGYGSGSATRADSSRGAASRSAMASQGGRSGAYAAGGGRTSTPRAGGFQGSGANRDAMGGYRSGSATRADSFRGGASRGSMSSGGGRAGGGAGGGRRGGGGRGR